MCANPVEVKIIDIMLRRILQAPLRFHTTTLLLLDWATFSACYNAAALYVRQSLFDRDAFAMDVLLISLGAISLLFYIVSGYDRRNDMESLRYTIEHILAGAMALFIVLVGAYVFTSYAAVMMPSRGAVLLSFIAFIPLSLTYRRFLSDRLIHYHRDRYFLVVGRVKDLESFYQEYKASRQTQRLLCVGLTEEDWGRKIGAKGEILIENDPEKRLDELDERCEGVILCFDPEHLPATFLDRVLSLYLKRIPVYTVESFSSMYWRKLPVYGVDLVWALEDNLSLARTEAFDKAKRLIDIALSIILLLPSAPLMLILGALVKLTSPGPAFFQQTRVGRYRKPFTLYKLRTMTHNPDTEPGDVYTRKNDPRVTPLGALLRKTRLDELPQLWNVLLGDMSLIGPRAEWSKLVEQYERNIPYYHLRHLVKPGITGWAQVNYPYGESEKDAIEKLKYDLYYIKNYSFILDAAIFLKTIFVMLFGRGGR